MLDAITRAAAFIRSGRMDIVATSSPARAFHGAG